MAKTAGGAATRPGDVVRVVVRAYGSPIPLGFFAFGIGMFLYAALGIGWVDPSQQESVGILIATFVFPLQLVATVFAFLARDGAAGTALGLFSTSWLAGGVLLVVGNPGVRDAALGYYLIAFSIVVVTLACASVVGRPLLSMFLLVSGSRAVFASIYELGGSHGWDSASGWAALAAFGVAIYGGLAFLLEDTLGRTVLPLGRIGAARESIEEGLDDQLAAIGNEAGLRRSL
jgi:succinate-acetate transporter protein